MTPWELDGVRLESSALDGDLYIAIDKIEYIIFLNIVWANTWIKETEYEERKEFYEAKPS